MRSGSDDCTKSLQSVSWCTVTQNRVWQRSEDGSEIMLREHDRAGLPLMHRSYDTAADASVATNITTFHIQIFKVYSFIYRNQQPEKYRHVFATNVEFPPCNCKVSELSTNTVLPIPLCV